MGSLRLTADLIAGNPSNPPACTAWPVHMHPRPNATSNPVRGSIRAPSSVHGSRGGILSTESPSRPEFLRVSYRNGARDDGRWQHWYCFWSSQVTYLRCQWPSVGGGVDEFLFVSSTSSRSINIDVLATISMLSRS